MTDQQASTSEISDNQSHHACVSAALGMHMTTFGDQHQPLFASSDSARGLDIDHAPCRGTGPTLLQNELQLASVDSVSGFEIEDELCEGEGFRHKEVLTFESSDMSKRVETEERTDEGSLDQNELQCSLVGSVGADLSTVSSSHFSSSAVVVTRKLDDGGSLEKGGDENKVEKESQINFELPSSDVDVAGMEGLELWEEEARIATDEGPLELECSLVGSVGADLCTVSMSHSSSSAVAATGKLGIHESGDDGGSLEKDGHDNKVEKESQINFGSDVDGAGMEGLELCGEAAMIATYEGPLDQNELQCSLVDSVGADLCAVSISHSSSSYVAVTGKLGIHESGDDHGSLEKDGDENKFEKESQINFEFPSSYVSGAGMKSLEICREEARIAKESMIKTEGSSSDEEEDEDGNLKKRVEEPRIAKETLLRKSESNESDKSFESSSSEEDDEEEEGDAGSFEKPGEVARIAKDSMLEAESSESEESSESSSSSSAEEEEEEDEDQAMEEYEEGELKESPIRDKKTRPKKQDIAVADDDSGDEEAYQEPIRGKNELKVQPRVPQVSVVLEPHHKTVPAGVISSAVGLCLVVEGTEGHEALNEGSILWLTEKRLPLGIVDELFGPVKKPFYIVRYNDTSEVPEGAKEGVEVSYVLEFAEHVLSNPDLYRKAYDASGENDEELSEAEIEFSDDEKELVYKKSSARTKRGKPEKCTQENDKQSQGSGKLDKRRQGKHHREANNRHQMKEGNRNVPHSSRGRGFFERSTRNHAPQFQQHCGPGLRTTQEGVDVQTMPTSMQQSQHPSVSQSPSYHQAPLQQFSASSQPQLLKQAAQVAPAFGNPLTNQPSFHIPQFQQHRSPGLRRTQGGVDDVQTMPTSMQQSQHPSVSQSPSYHQGPLQQFSASSQPGFGNPLTNQPSFHSGVATRAMPNYMQYSEQPPVYQSPIYQQAPQQEFPSASQPQLSRQTIQVPPSFGMPLSNQSPQFLNTATTNSLYTGMQVSAAPSPVLGIPAGPVNTLSFSTQLGFNQSFSPLLAPLPPYRGNPNTPGIPSAWGFPEQSRHPQLHPGTPTYPLQQQPPQQGPPFFFDQRMTPRQG